MITNIRNRILYIDRLKAFSMFLVVWGHSGLPQDSVIRTLIYSFHIPFFVFLSGFFAKIPNSLLESLKKSFFTLVIPYLFFSLLLIPFDFVLHKLEPGGGIFIDPLQYKLLMDDKYSCGPIWFLGALLIIKLVFNCLGVVLKRTTPNKEKFKAMSLLSFVALIYYLDLKSIISLFSVDTAIALFPFYLSAWLFRNYICNRFRLPWLAVYGLLVLFVFLSVFNGYIDFDQMKLGNNLIVTYLTALIGCVVFFYIGYSYLNDKNFYKIEKMGEDSIGILGLHIVIIQPLRWIYKYAIDQTIPFWYLFFISCSTFYLSYCITLLIIKVNPKLLGKV